MVVQVRCPAKVNLGLSVHPKDPSGYHPLRTTFQAIGLNDELILETDVMETQLISNWQGLPAENTVTKCLQLVRELVSIPPLRISLRKRIPAESGLGGGSSNAAGLLRALRKILDSPLPPVSEVEVATAVGADVPFFLVGGRAEASGYGELLNPLPDHACQWFVIVRPQVGVSTAAAYAALDSMDDRTPSDPHHCINDFELVAPPECLELKARLLELEANCSLLCGSGSAVFGTFNTESSARSAAIALDSSTCSTWVIPSLTREESLWIS